MSPCKTIEHARPFVPTILTRVAHTLTEADKETDDGVIQRRVRVEDATHAVKQVYAVTYPCRHDDHGTESAERPPNRTSTENQCAPCYFCHCRDYRYGRSTRLQRMPLDEAEKAQ